MGNDTCPGNERLGIFSLLMQCTVAVAHKGDPFRSARHPGGQRLLGDPATPRYLGCKQRVLAEEILYGRHMLYNIIRSRYKSTVLTATLMGGAVMHAIRSRFDLVALVLLVLVLGGCATGAAQTIYRVHYSLHQAPVRAAPSS